MTKELEEAIAARIYHSLYPTSNFYDMKGDRYDQWLNMVREVFTTSFIDELIHGRRYRPGPL